MWVLNKLLYLLFETILESETVSNNLPSPRRVVARSHNSIKDAKCNVGTEQIIALTVWNNQSLRQCPIIYHHEEWQPGQAALLQMVNIAWVLNKSLYLLFETIRVWDGVQYSTITTKTGSQLPQL